jgi:hypothetical protein
MEVPESESKAFGILLGRERRFPIKSDIVIVLWVEKPCFVDVLLRSKPVEHFLFVPSQRVRMRLIIRIDR